MLKRTKISLLVIVLQEIAIKIKICIVLSVAAIRVVVVWVKERFKLGDLLSNVNLLCTFHKSFLIEVVKYKFYSFYDFSYACS